MSSLVSVVIPTYKRSYDTLYRAIKSVLDQSYSCLEIIIVDDSPKDYEQRELIKSSITKIDNRINYIQHDKNLGACRARNTGIRNSKGKYIAFLDDDDQWLPKKIELQLEKFKDNEVGLVYCSSITKIVRDGEVVEERVRSYTKKGWVFEELILNNFIGSTSFVLIKKEVFKKVGYFNENIRSAQDAELFLRISKKFKVDYVNIPLVYYYEHDQERISLNLDNKIQGLEKINELYNEYLKKTPKAMSIRLHKLIPFYLEKYGFKYSIKVWLKALKTYPFSRMGIKYCLWQNKNVGYGIPFMQAPRGEPA